VLPPAPPTRRFSYSEADSSCTARRALVNDRFKYIYTTRNEEQLLFQMYWRFTGLCPASCFTLPLEEFFDLRTDPSEEQNLLAGALDEEQAKALETFREEMRQHLNLPRAYALQVRTGQEEMREPPITESFRRALKALGYIQ
jgi:hypothetical protein